jgi:hypothetical protein
VPADLEEVQAERIDLGQYAVQCRPVQEPGELTSEIASIDDAPAAFERLRDASTMKILIAPNGP